MTSYTIHDHQFNFAIWAAARAYQRGVSDTAMSVPYNTAKDAGLNKITSPEHIGDFDLLGLSKPAGLDESNRAAVVDEWTTALIQSIQYHSTNYRLKAKAPLPFGNAAKLLSVYLKAVLLNEANLSHPNTALIHPPIDDILLKAVTRDLKEDPTANPAAYHAFFDALYPGCNGPRSKHFAWQKMEKGTYIKIVSAFRILLAGKPLWMIEEAWNPKKMD